MKPEFPQRTGSYSEFFALPRPAHRMLLILLYLLHFANKERTLAVLPPYLNHSRLDLASQVFGWVTGNEDPGMHYQA